MTRRYTRGIRGRRELLRLAALGLGGFVVACSRGGGEPRTTNGGSSGQSAGSQTTPAPGGKGNAGTAATATLPPQLAGAQPQCLVTKQIGLPPSYSPPDLRALPTRVLASDGVRMREPAGDAVVRLVDGAVRDGHKLFVLSGFRSYQDQDKVLRDEIVAYGKETAERQVAPPGHSEHQLGLAADITSDKAPYELRPEFGQEPEGRWLSSNAPKFGFVISYPQGKEPVTGYTYEPWHIRYVGEAIAEEVAASGLTLTEFLPKYNLAGGCAG